MAVRLRLQTRSEVTRTIREDLGADPEELFAQFEHSPIASASLAQVRLHLLAAVIKISVAPEK